MVGGPRIPCAGNSTSKLPNSCAAHTPVDQSIKARHDSEASPLGPHTTSEASPLGPFTRFRFNILPYTSEASPLGPLPGLSDVLSDVSSVCGAPGRGHFSFIVSRDRFSGVTCRKIIMKKEWNPNHGRIDLFIDLVKMVYIISTE